MTPAERMQSCAHDAAEEMARVAMELAVNSKPLPDDCAQVLRDHYWELLCD